MGYRGIRNTKLRERYKEIRKRVNVDFKGTWKEVIPGEVLEKNGAQFIW